MSRKSQQLRSKISTCGLLIIIFVLAGVAAFAQENPSESGHAQWQAMRQVMIAACAGKSDGTPCSFSRDGQPVNGICHTSRRGQLLCRSGHHRQSQGNMGGSGGGMPGGAPEGGAPQ